jgi:hypothetical protein
MLMPSLPVLQEALNRYRTLAGSEHRHDEPAAVHKLQDVVYTLCVLTGTRAIDSALSAAERMCSPGSGPLDRMPPPHLLEQSELRARNVNPLLWHETEGGL